MFPRTSKKTPGYSVREVEEFLATARQAFDAPEQAEATDAREAPATVLSAADIRHTAFAMQKGGYAPAHVDAALERLEDAFAARERESGARRNGEQAWLDEADATTGVILARLNRGSGRRFARTSFLSVGYRRQDVDRLATRIVKHFEDDRPVTVDEVRTAVFRPERGGYREAQVDLLLDDVVTVILMVR